jgi:hypothetical protein
VPDELTKALLLEEVVAPGALAEALYVSVTSSVPLVHALVDTGAVPADVLVRYLGRAETPFLRHVVPVPDVVEQLPRGLCERLLAVPVRRDAISGVIDVVIADATDEHAAREIAFHLQVPVRVVRAPLPAIEDALRRLRRPRTSLRPDDELLFDSRPRAGSPWSSRTPPSSSAEPPATSRSDAQFRTEPPPPARPDARLAHTVPSVPPMGPRLRKDTPTWGTPVHANAPEPSEHPKSGLGSEIPIPLTRRTFTAVAGGTQRPPPMVSPQNAGLGDGYPVDPLAVRSIVEVRSDVAEGPLHSFIPGPPPAAFAAYAPSVGFDDLVAIHAALRAAGTRDEVLELVLTGARTVAARVALFVVKRTGYLGWTCTPEFGDRVALQSVLVPLDVASVFDRAVYEGLYLGPISHDAAHAALLQLMRGATRDVAVVPIRVTGKPAMFIVADELTDTMMATQRLDELAEVTGEALARLVRTRRG